jgi:hypothetical protein
MLTGTIVNVLAIVIGTTIGLIIKRGLKEALSRAIIKGISLAVLVIGISGALGTNSFVIVIFSMVLGTILGTMMKIEDRLDRLGQRLNQRFGQGDSPFVEGFVTASLIFCVGAMAVVGSIESGLQGNHSTLFAKSLLDGTTSLILSSTMGLGVLFSALAVLVYQGGITLLASTVAPYLTEAVLAEMSAVGGLLILGMGINMLELGRERIPVGNMLPAMFIPVLLLQFF